MSGRPRLEYFKVLHLKGEWSMKIVVLDGYTENPGDLSWEPLKALGELTVYDRTPVHDNEEILQRIGGAEVVFTNKTPLKKEVLAKCPGLKFISMLATGYNVVDVAAAKALGIPVSNIPTYGTDSVGQFAIALLLEICHHIGHHDQAVHEGKWEHNADWCFWDYPLIELAGKTMGIIGFGRIGQRTGALAKALKMEVLAFDAYPNEAGREIAAYVDLDTLLAKSDVIALHCPLFPETEGIINKNNIAKMKDGVIILNNSRGPLIVEADLAEALNSGKVAAAGVDVVSTEPINGDNPLLKAKNCLITPHMSWAPKESRQRIMDMSVENVKAYLAGKPVNVVNK
jgi:glycerate dehydrogenase